jgi:hypothetical protein
MIYEKETRICRICKAESKEWPGDEEVFCPECNKLIANVVRCILSKNKLAENW